MRDTKDTPSPHPLPPVERPNNSQRSLLQQWIRNSFAIIRRNMLPLAQSAHQGVIAALVIHILSIARWQRNVVVEAKLCSFLRCISHSIQPSMQ